MHADRCGNTRRQKCCAKGSGKEVKIQDFMYRETTNVEPERYDYTSNNWSHWIITRSWRKNLEAVPGKHSIDDSYTWNIKYNTERYCSVKLEPWALGITAGSREAPGRKGLWHIYIYIWHPYNKNKKLIIIIIIIIIIRYSSTYNLPWMTKREVAV